MLIFFIVDLNLKEVMQVKTAATVSNDLFPTKSCSQHFAAAAYKPHTDYFTSIEGIHFKLAKPTYVVIALTKEVRDEKTGRGRGRGWRNICCVAVTHVRIENVLST